MADRLTLKFRCQCGEHEFSVRYREKREDVAEWLKVVQVKMGEAHSRMVPMCMATTCDLMIPHTDGVGVGMRTEH